MLRANGEFRARFVANHPFPLDRFQLEALDLLDRDQSVLVAAPTGSGKTVVAEYAVAQAFERDERAFYTTPLKALSNQKYTDFARIYGESNVGLLTGDVVRNPLAPIVVMTTEVLRNMIYAGPSRLSDVHCVILDEVHYLEDRYRGSVWEEIILSAPASIVLVALSATVSNAEELAGWITGVRGATGAVIEDRRPIELRHLYVVGDRESAKLHLFPVFVDGRPNPEASALDGRLKRIERTRPGRGPRPMPRNKGPLYAPRRFEVVERLGEEDLLPAIFFVFSRAGCDDAVRECLDAGVRLTTPEERREIRAIADEHVDALSDSDLQVLGYSRFRHGLENGIAAHHAGMVPPFREAVEALFSQALVKVVFATETLALGINMPARTVVIGSLSKFGGAGHQDLTAGEYTQLTGRAGRRGIDEVGYSAVLYSPFHTFDQVASLASARSRPLSSSFRPTYNMAVNLVKRYDRDAAYRLVRSSFAQYLSEVPLTRQLDAVLATLSERGYLDHWELTEAGEQLAGIYHDCDLLVVEAMRAGIFDGLDAPSLAAVVSLFTFEARRAQGNQVNLPNARLQKRAARLMDLSEQIRADERLRGLPRTRRLDPGFARLAFDWASGSELRTVLGGGSHRAIETGISGGDFVRNVKQLGDLLRQLAIVAGSERLATVARRSADQLLRGVVAASSVAPTVGSDEVADDPRED